MDRLAVQRFLAWLVGWVGWNCWVGVEPSSLPSKTFSRWHECGALHKERAQNLKCFLIWELLGNDGSRVAGEERIQFRRKQLTDCTSWTLFGLSPEAMAAQKSSSSSSSWPDPSVVSHTRLSLPHWFQSSSCFAFAKNFSHSCRNWNSGSVVFLCARIVPMKPYI